MLAARFGRLRDGVEGASSCLLVSYLHASSIIFRAFCPWVELLGAT